SRSAINALPSGRNAMPHGTSRLVAVSLTPASFGCPRDSTSLPHETTHTNAEATTTAARFKAARTGKSAAITHVYPQSPGDGAHTVGCPGSKGPKTEEAR